MPTIITQSFELESVPGGQFTDPATDGTSLALNTFVDVANIAGQPVVDSTSASDGTLGFDLDWVNSLGDVGISDGDFIGVTDFTGTVGAFTDGTQGYQLSDADGLQVLTFDVIDISGFTNVNVSIDYFIQETGWELSDFISIGVSTDTGFVTMLSTFGQDIDDLSIEGSFTTDTVVLDDAATMATITIVLQSNSSSETLYLDNIVVTGDEVSAAFDLQITEMWAGNDQGSNLTADWFELTNTGDAAWVRADDGDLYFDDDSQDPAVADLMQGIDTIAPGESVIFLDDGDIAAFQAIWGGVIELANVQVGSYFGSGLSGGGDGVTVFIEGAETQGDGLLEDAVLVDFEAYPDTASNPGQSFDVDAQQFSGDLADQSGVATTDVNDAGEAAVGSPGNGAPIVAPAAAFTLELLHIADQEASSGAIVDAPNLSAVLNALRAEDLGGDGLPDNTLTLSSGDAFIPGVFFAASEDVYGAAGIADILIQNELGFDAVALGNHEFDTGTGPLSRLISGETFDPGTSATVPLGTDQNGNDFTGTNFSYLSSNLDFSTDANLAPLAVAGGGASTGNTVSSSIVSDVNGEKIGVVGATTPTLASISSPGDVGIAPTPFDPTPTPEQLDALAVVIQAEVDALLTANPDMNKVILLAHMQQLDIELALAERLVDVDIIVAGGSNTRLFDDDDRARDGDSDQGQYPQFVTNAGGTTTAVVNTDGSYKYVGRLVIDFDEDGNILADSYDADVSGAYATDAQGVSDLGAAGLIDPEIQAIVDDIEAQLIATEGNVFGVSDVFLNGNRSGTFTADDPDGVRTQETNLGNLTADANLAAAQAADATVLVSLKNGGGIRADIGDDSFVPAGGTEATRIPNEEITDSAGNVVKPEGGISQNDIATTLAFNNDLVLMTLTKAELVALLEHGVDALPGVSGRFPQVSGVKFSFDQDLPSGDKIVNAGIFDENDALIMELVRDGEIAGDASDLIRIVTLGFLAAPRFDSSGNFTGGGDGYPFPNTNTDPTAGEVGPDAARINLVALENEGVQTGNATFADDGTEQDALAEYLFDNFNPDNGGTAFNEADTGPALDERIQNLDFRADTVFGVVESGLFETFDTADGFTTSEPFFSDGSFDYFGIADGLGGGDFGGDPAPNPAGTNAYSGTDGNYLVGSDLDGEGAALPITIEWSDIDVSDLSVIEFRADFAEALDDSGPDRSDFILVEAALDDGAFETVLVFRGDEEFNGLFRVDTDGDGTGDGDALSDAMANFSSVIDGTGTSLDLRISLQINAGFEDIAIDNVEIREFALPPFEIPDEELDVTIAGTVTLAGSEIVDFDAATQQALVTSGGGLQVLDVSDVSAPVLTATLAAEDLGFDSSDITSVSVRNGVIAVARPDPTGVIDQDPSDAFTGAGQVLFYGAATLGFLGFVQVGPLPDMLVWNETGTHLLVANEGQSSGDENQPDALENPNGSVSIIELNATNPTASTVTTLDFTDSSIDFDALEAKGVRVNRDAPSAAADLEPEYITIEGNTAFIALQENNAVAVIDDITAPTAFTIDDILALGTKDHSVIGNELDPSNRDSGINIANYDINGMFMPDGMDSYTVDGVQYFLTANEGDGRDVDESRGADLVDGDLTNGEIDTTEMSAELQAQLADDALLGRLKFSNVDGDTDGDGLIEELFSFGARSFTIFDENGTPVFDSGSDFERITEVLAPDAFNSNGQASSFDSRSDDKGPEPEAVVLGEVDGTTYAFIGLERVGGIMVYDVSDPTAPTFTQYIRNEDVDGNLIDVGPEGLRFIPAADSPTGEALLAVSSEESNTLTFHEISVKPAITPPPTLISQVQGSSDFSAITSGFATVGIDDVSPLLGETVTVEAIVTADFQGDDELGGFFLQEEDADADGDALTSEGIFVFDGALTDDVNVGDLVSVTGTVAEFFGQTQITASFIEVVSSGNILPTATVVEFPTVGVMLDDDGEHVADLEAVEGMLITIPTAMSVTEMFNLDRFGEYRVSSDGRLEQFSQTNTPDAAGFEQHLIDNAARSLVLDDGSTVQNPAVIEIIDGNDGVLTSTDSFRMGDTITNATGVLNYAFDEFRLQEGTGDYSQENPRPASPDEVGGTVQVASLNVLNFFTTIDNGSNVTDTGLGPRGADSVEEFDRQLEKLVTAIVEMDADILGLVEIENTADDRAISALVDAVNAVAGAGTYAFVDAATQNGGPIGGDAITNGFIYKAAAVTPVGGVEILTTFNGIDFLDPLSAGRPLNRPAVTQTFQDNAHGETVTIAVNHLKSKGSLSGLAADEDQLDGAGNNNATREAASDLLAQWLATDPTGQGSENVLILGDLNAYAEETPVTVLEAAGFTDLASDALNGDTRSFVFDGQTGTLDYALANEALTGRVRGATEWHINADEADAIDYNLDFGRDPSLFDGTSPARNSDHDPVIVGLDLRPEVLGVAGFDRVEGTAADEIINGGGGNDVYVGGGGADLFVATDDDTIRVIDFDIALNAIDLTDWGTQGITELSIRSNPGGDRVIVSDLVSGDMMVLVERSIALDPADLTEDNFVFDFVRDLTVTGTDDAGIEVLFGRSGDDVLDGGLGRDRYTGNDGADIFVGGTDDLDVILDFVAGEDRIDVSNWGITAFDDLLITDTNQVNVRDASGNRMVVQSADAGFQASDLTEDSFLFADLIV